MKDFGRQKDRQRRVRKELASLVEKHSCNMKACSWGQIESGGAGVGGEPTENAFK